MALVYSKVSQIQCILKKFYKNKITNFLLTIFKSLKHGEVQHFFFYKQLVYKHTQAEIINILSTS